jgi:hypothetical protein
MMTLWFHKRLDAVSTHHVAARLGSLRFGGIGEGFLAGGTYPDGQLGLVVLFFGEVDAYDGVERVVMGFVFW